MNTFGSARARFRISEGPPERADWGHSAYVTVETQEHFQLDNQTELAISFNPRRGTTFEDVKKLIEQLNAVLEKVNFDLSPAQPGRSIGLGTQI